MSKSLWAINLYFFMSPITQKHVPPIRALFFNNSYGKNVSNSSRNETNEKHIKPPTKYAP